MDGRSQARSLLAGYDPERLSAGKVLVIGLGAVGQNLVQNIALIGVGHLLLVDFGAFEPQDETCAPYYPTNEESARLGMGKAAVVAHRAATAGTASELTVHYRSSLIQAFGDGAIDWADVVVSAVDNPAARAWIADRCRLLGKPMVEGNICGADFDVSAYAATADAPCHRCGRQDQDSALSHDPLTAEAAAIIPAMQNSAAAAAALQSEQVMQLLHRKADHLGYRSDGNVRRGTLRKTRLVADPSCPGIHAPEPVIGTVSGIHDDTTVGQLVATITRRFGAGKISLSETAIMAAKCVTCGTTCQVRATESAWLVNPNCVRCGGLWPTIVAEQPASFSQIDTDGELPAALAATLASALGLRAGSCLIVSLSDGKAGLLQITGKVLACAERAVPAKPAALPEAGHSLARWVLP